MEYDSLILRHVVTYCIQNRRTNDNESILKKQNTACVVF